MQTLISRNKSSFKKAQFTKANYLITRNILLVLRNYIKLKYFLSCLCESNVSDNTSSNDKLCSLSLSMHMRLRKHNLS